MKNFSFKYGKGEIDFQIPEESILQELTIANLPVIENPKQAILDAINNPIGSKPLKSILKKGETVSIIVNDSTRVANTHIFLPILLDEINSYGIPDENMSIIFALGTHRPMSNDEIEKEIGKEAMQRIKHYSPDCHDTSQFKNLGKTSFGTEVLFYNKIFESDHIICTGSIVHHFFAGFGGGRKAMFPGISHYDSISNNHSLLFSDKAASGQLEGNPVYDDQIEAVKMHPPSFLINVVLNANKEFLGVYAGDYIEAHLKACQMVDDAYGVKIKEEADLVIATCGGYPKDINVYQLQKTMDNAHKAVKDGGVVILFGECIEGSGSEVYENIMKECRTPDQVEEKVRKNFQIGAHKAYAVTRLMKKAKFILISELSEELSDLLLFDKAKNFDEAYQKATDILGKNPKTILMPQGSLTFPILENK